MDGGVALGFAFCEGRCQCRVIFEESDGQEVRSIMKLHFFSVLCCVGYDSATADSDDDDDIKASLAKIMGKDDATTCNADDEFLKK